MIQNKKGLSDIVTTALIILLVAVAVAAIWAFIAPALRGTGTQFTKTQVCVSNIIEPITCKTSVGGGAGNFPITVQVRRTLTDGVAVPTEFETAMGTAPAMNRSVTTDTATTPTIPTTTKTPTIKIPKSQGELVEIILNSGTAGQSAGSSPQSLVTTSYRLPDNTFVKCPSLPISCNIE